MSDTPKTLTLRRVEVGEKCPGDYWVETLAQTRQDHHSGNWYREVSPIPDGYEACDLADATKVLIGETWCLLDEDKCLSNLVGQKFGVTNLGVLAIRPIPEPEPMRAEAKVLPFSETEPSCYGWARIPNELIGRRIRWEVIE